ncbi:MAG TPA: serine/threonine-protein kinase, partial [Planctomycetota bacterium]|nr:serine/threonine-protein kinase [Planctomycetota bacterium]
MATDVTCLQCGKPYDASVVANRFAGVCPACLARFASQESDVEPSPGIADPAMKPPLKLGGTFHGLEVVELLGAGGMGVVYKARQPGLDRFVALKVLSPKLTSDVEFIARFNREAKAMAALSHNGIVQVFDYGQEADLCYLVMEYVDGLSLRQLMKERRLSPDAALKVVPKICEALGYAHSKGVIHRDIKPENILLDREGRLKIADFGLARVVAPDGAGAQVTNTNVVMGTPGYMAPEQYQSMKVDHRADIYSLGAVFYEMLTGEVPIGRFDVPSSKVQIDVRL